MDSTQSAVTAAGSPGALRPKPMDDERKDRSVARPAQETGDSSGPFSLYRPGQGANVRWGSAIGGALLAVGAAMYVYESLMPRIQGLLGMSDDSFGLIRLLAPVGVLAGLVYLVWHYVGRSPRAVDFMVATEGEMKRVNWSTRREIIGSTRVVIFTILALAFILFIFDAIFIIFFSLIRVIRIDLGTFFSAFTGGGST